MLIRFSIHYQTVFGEELFLSLSSDTKRYDENPSILPMQYRHPGIWTAELELPKSTPLLAYRYFLRKPEGDCMHERSPYRNITLNSRSHLIDIHDQWMGENDYSPFLTDPFTEVFFDRPDRKETPTHTSLHELIIRVSHPNIPSDAFIHISGNTPELGQWDPAKALPLKPIHGGRWEVRLKLKSLATELEYKFLLRRPIKNSPFLWEDVMNRRLSVPPLPIHSSYLIEHAVLGFPIFKPRFSGIAVPVFSLRTKESSGFGDFGDLKQFIDWAALCKQRIVQILPVNDTCMTHTWTDSYPYGAISVMALHPLYLNLKMLGELKDAKAASKFAKRQQRLNQLPQIDYPAVEQHKWEYFRAIFRQDEARTLADPDYLAFFEENRSWLLPYAAFCVLRDMHKSADFHNWGPYAQYDKALIEDFCTSEGAHKQEISLHCYLQYHLHKQLSGAKAHARKRGVILKGDIPIGITPHSVDAWTDPQLFNMQEQAGAPPDDFSAAGQNWGFPTYNWDEMARDGYRWWKQRLHKMAQYFDAYRIDHVLGFFRIWEIPKEYTEGLMGHFSPALPYSPSELSAYGFLFNKERDTALPDPLFLPDPYLPEHYHPKISAQHSNTYHRLEQGQKDAFNRLYDHFFYYRHNKFWEDQALKKLPELISSTNMLSCAEDLGMIPACVPHTLHMLHILSLEIQRMPKDPSVRFANPAAYPYLSVCSTGTHDTATLREWWEEESDRSAQYYAQMLHETGVSPYFCEPWLCVRILQEHLKSPSMLAVFPFQDWLSISPELRRELPQDERINDPSNPKHYWRYRMHLNIEDLLANKEFNEYVSKMVEHSGRG